RCLTEPCLEVLMHCLVDLHRGCAAPSTFRGDEKRVFGKDGRCLLSPYRRFLLNRGGKIRWRGDHALEVHLSFRAFGRRDHARDLSVVLIGARYAIAYPPFLRVPLPFGNENPRRLQLTA